MNNLVKGLIAIGVVLTSSVVGFLFGVKNSESYHKKEINKEIVIISNINLQLEELEATIKNDNKTKESLIRQKKENIKRLLEEKKRHEYKIAKHKEELKKIVSR